MTEIDIKLIPTDELLSDRLESKEDIKNCCVGIMQGLTVSGDTRLAKRIYANDLIILKIDAELERRRDGE